MDYLVDFIAQFGNSNSKSATNQIVIEEVAESEQIGSKEKAVKFESAIESKQNNRFTSSDVQTIKSDTNNAIDGNIQLLKESFGIASKNNAVAQDASASSQDTEAIVASNASDVVELQADQSAIVAENAALANSVANIGEKSGSSENIAQVEKTAGEASSDSSESVQNVSIEASDFSETSGTELLVSANNDIESTSTSETSGSSENIAQVEKTAGEASGSSTKFTSSEVENSAEGSIMQASSNSVSAEGVKIEN